MSLVRELKQYAHDKKRFSLGTEIGASAIDVGDYDTARKASDIAGRAEQEGDYHKARVASQIARRGLRGFEQPQVRTPGRRR